MEYDIRLATISDCLELSKLKHDVWNETYRGIYSDEKIDNFDYEKNKDKFVNMVKDPNVKLYVVLDDDRLIGYVEAGIPYRPYKDYKQEIGLLYLLKEYQGRGIGKKMFSVAYDTIKENGYDEFFVCCNKYNEKAQEFYKHMGGVVDEIDDNNNDKSIPQVKFLYKIRK